MVIDTIIETVILALGGGIGGILGYMWSWKQNKKVIEAHIKREVDKIIWARENL